MRARRNLRAILVAASLVGGASPATAQEIRGTLYAAETGTPLPYGVIELLDTDLQVVAIAYGDEVARFALVAPGPGRYALRGSHMNALPLLSGTVDLVEGQVAVVELALPLQPIEMDPLMVSVRPELRQLVRKGFYERARSGLGAFITPEKVEKRNPFKTSDLLFAIPGVRLVPDPNRVGHYRPSFPRSEMAFSGGFAAGSGGTGCRPTIIIDDMIMQHGSGGTEFDIDDLPAQDILAMEVYRSWVEIPMQYSGGGQTCGVIVIWTGKRIEIR